jgi:hypothetical protein
MHFMSTLCPTEARKSRFQVTRLEDRIAPAGSLLNLVVNVDHVNIPITVAYNNIQVGVQLVAINSSQVFYGVT